MTHADMAYLDDVLRVERQSFDRITAVGIAPLLDGGDPHKVIHDICGTYAPAAFKHVKNHGIAQETAAEDCDQARSFLDLPMNGPTRWRLS